MVKFDVSGIDQFEVAKRLGDSWRKTPQIMATAINYTIGDLRDMLSKKIQETYAIKTNGFRKAWEKNKIDKATPQDPVAVVHIKGKRLSFAEYILNPSKRPKKQPEYYKGKFLTKVSLKNFVAQNGNKGFFAKMPKTGHQGIFYRIAQSSENRKIAEMTAPSLPQLVKGENVYDIVSPKINIKLQDNITKLIKRELERK